tara:strand:- start:252 stop:659 length:408 start_codon:yes stop_codon:yes gene_type:complete
MIQLDLTQLELCFLLFIAFQIKHFLADFPLQVSYMIFHKTSAKWDFFVPLMLHSLVHSSFTLIITLLVAPQVWWLFIVDTVVHFTMDRLKSNPHYLGRYNDITKGPFWWCLGFDQMVHHLTDIFSVWIIVHAVGG